MYITMSKVIHVMFRLGFCQTEDCLELNAVAVAEEEKGERILSDSKGNLVWKLYLS